MNWWPTGELDYTVAYFSGHGMEEPKDSVARHVAVCIVMEVRGSPRCKLIVGVVRHRASRARQPLCHVTSAHARPPAIRAIAKGQVPQRRRTVRVRQGKAVPSLGE